MSRLPRPPLPIQWHEGMLLSPHHFQQQDLRWDALLVHQAANLSPFPWGVLELSFDLGALKDGILRVLTVSGLFPDGLAFEYSAGEDPELAVTLAPYLERLSAEPLPVHLAICGVRPGQNLLKGELARYDSVEVEGAVDVNTGDGELAIPRLRPKLQLRLEDAPPAKFVSFPLARITYQNGQFTFADYVPPCLRVDPGSRLGSLCADLASRLREKAVYLTEQMRAPSAAERAPQTLERRLQVHALSAGLPPLEALLATGRAHPFSLYLALCGVLGQVAVLGNQPVPPRLLPYDQNDPLRAFAEVRRIVFGAAEEGVRETFSAYPFHLEGDRFSLVFDPAWVGRPLVLGVRARPGITEKESIEWMEGALIGSQSRLPALRKNRVRGADRRRIDSAGDLVPGRDVTLWTLHADPEVVVPSDLLEIRNLDDAGKNRPVEIVLYLRKGV
jgi:type VI secretion system protein ImpJ